MTYCELWYRRLMHKNSRGLFATMSKGGLSPRHDAQKNRSINNSENSQIISINTRRDSLMAYANIEGK